MNDFNNFKKKDLKTGMVAELRNGLRLITLKGDLDTDFYGSQSLMFVSNKDFINGSDYDDNLLISKNNHGYTIADKKFDIMKVYKSDIMALKHTLENDNLSDSQLLFDREQLTPEVDWSKIPVDAKVLVSNDGEHWQNKHFCKSENGKLYTWYRGNTSFSANDKHASASWNYMKLYNENECEDK